MEDHKLILNLIEEVDPSDTAKLDEIDARVWCWINGIEFKKPLLTKNLRDGGMRVFAYRTSIGDISTYMTPRPPEGKEWKCRHRLKYTRRRDALKAIRPNGYYSYAQPVTDYGEKSVGLEFIGTCTSNYHSFDTLDIDIDTEELAELHAIIQAITYERGIK